MSISDMSIIFFQIINNGKQIPGRIHVEFSAEYTQILKSAWKDTV